MRGAFKRESEGAAVAFRDVREQTSFPIQPTGNNYQKPLP